MGFIHKYIPVALVSELGLAEKKGREVKAE